MNAQALRLTQNRWGFIAFMSVICCLSPFAMSFLVPAFPSISGEFGKPVADIQFLISVFLIGLGVAQPIHGMLADRFGRRPVLLIGFGIFTVASIMSVVTSSWTALVLCRLFQAIGVSAGTVISRTIVNDVQTREEAAESLSYISIAMGVGPILAPIFGGIFDTQFGWRSIFLGCALAGIFVWALAIFRLPETRLVSQEPRNFIQDYRRLLKSPQFIGYTLLFGFGQGIFFAFLPIAPDYFETVLGRSTSFFVASWIALSLAFMTGSLIGGRLTKRVGMDKAIFRGSIWLIFSGVIMVALYAGFGDHPYVVTFALAITLLGTGLICPLALAGSISLDPKLAATAAGLSSSLGLMLGGLFTVLGGVVYDATLWPFIGLVGLAILGNFLAMVLSRLKKREPEK